MTPSRPRAATAPTTLDEVRDRVIACERCPRLRAYCREVARVKKAAYREQVYWGRPVPGFGDPLARILILGLAPAAHGGNRTGRVFTGDGTGGSGDFLMAALHRAGYANIATSTTPDDGLTLRGVYIAAAARCAPPDNKPTPQEIATCLGYVEEEIALLPRLEVVVALGKIAWDAWLLLLDRQGVRLRPKPAFAHGHVVRPGDLTSTPSTPGTRALRHPGTLIGCFHPSRQNTNTGKVTPAMYDNVFQRLVRL
jgi:uracil-DNA glycosylase family 4